MKLKKVLAGLMAAVIATTASVCGLSVGAGAATKQITYIGHEHDIMYIPPLYVYSNAEYGAYISSAGHVGSSAIEIESSKAEIRLMEDIKPTDIITFSIIPENGKEEVLDVWFETTNYKSPILTSYGGLNDKGVYSQRGVFRSGVSVQEMIDQYNKDLADMHWLNEFKDVKDITFNNISSICVYKNYTDIKDYGNFTWKIIIEPGDNNSVKSSKKISDLQFSSIKNQAYSGKAIKPTVTVKDGDKKLVNGTDYTVSYKNNTNIGTATVTITGKGDYTGTKTLTFKIVPKKVALTGKASGAKETLSWKKSAGATGYVVYRSVDGGKFTKLATTKSLKYTAKLTSGKKYQFKVRPYTTVNGSKVYGSWSNIVSAN